MKGSLFDDIVEDFENGPSGWNKNYRKPHFKKIKAQQAQKKLMEDLIQCPYCNKWIHSKLYTKHLRTHLTRNS